MEPFSNTFNGPGSHLIKKYRNYFNHICCSRIFWTVCVDYYIRTLSCSTWTPTLEKNSPVLKLKQWCPSYLNENQCAHLFCCGGGSSSDTVIWHQTYRLQVRLLQLHTLHYLGWLLSPPCFRFLLKWCLGCKPVPQIFFSAAVFRLWNISYNQAHVL